MFPTPHAAGSSIMHFSNDNRLGCLQHDRLLEHTAVQTSLRAVAIVTIRYVMDSGLHYPARLLFLQMLMMAVVELAVTLASRFCKADFDTKATSAQNEDRTSVSSSILKLARMFCTAGALFCEFQALWHFTTLPALVMLLSIDFPLVLYGPEKWHSKFVAVMASSAGVALVCAFETHLARRGLIMVVVSVTLRGMATRLSAWNVSTAEEQGTASTEATRGVASDYSHRLTVILIALALCLVMILRSESPIYTPSSIPSHGMGLLLAFTTGALVLRDNFSLVAQRTMHRHHLTICSGDELVVAPVALVALTAVGGALSGAASTMVVWQLLGFANCLLGRWIALQRYRDEEEDYRQVLPSTEGAKSQRVPDGQQSVPAHRFSIVWLTLLSSFAIAMYFTSGSNTIAGLNMAHLCTAPAERNRSFEIVLSRYHEPAEMIAHQVESMLQLGAFQNRSTRVIVYDTGHSPNSTFSIDMRSLVDPKVELSVHPRENVGREGAAYLHHMNSSYDNLADHTLFMQAAPHEPRYLRQRLQDYFVDHTGFLSLSQVQEYCSDCDACWDHSTWSESRDVLEEVLGQSCEGFTLTYRGQFVVSKARIHAHAREHYQKLLNELTDPRSQKHSAAYLNRPWMPGKLDSLNSPRFGYTLERTWGALMGCADQRLTVTCPSMESAAINSLLAIRPTSLEECQCLDEIP